MICKKLLQSCELTNNGLVHQQVEAGAVTVRSEVVEMFDKVDMVLKMLVDAAEYEAYGIADEWIPN